VRNGDAGSIFGSFDKDGYLQGTIHRQKFKLHRLAFLYMTGSMPPEVDHRNRIRNDNRWLNLRASTRAQNTQHAAMQSNNESGVKGVYRRGKKFSSEIQANGKRYRIGGFETIDDAAEFVQLAREMAHGSFACHG
jgi:hypothetical protein